MKSQVERGYDNILNRVWSWAYRVATGKGKALANYKRAKLFHAINANEEFKTQAAGRKKEVCNFN